MIVILIDQTQKIQTKNKKIKEIKNWLKLESIRDI